MWVLVGEFNKNREKMKGIYLILLMFSLSLSAQSLEERMSKDMCECLTKYKDRMDDNAIQCYEKVGLKYYSEMYQEMERKKLNNVGDYLATLERHLVKHCPLLLEVYKEKYQQEEKESISDCEDLKIGNYYYEPNNTERRNYLTFTENQVIENRRGGIYTYSKIEWVDKCTYKLTLEKSNGHYENEHLKNHSQTYKIIENNNDYFVVQTQYYENGGFNNVKVYKLSYKITK